MKRGLAIPAACVLLVWLAACRPTQVAERITVTSLSSRVDTNDPSYAVCQSFALTPYDVSRFFRVATEVSGWEFHARAVILPCRYEGTLTIGEEASNFSINAGGAGHLYGDDGSRRRYLCEQRCQKALARVFGAD